MRTTEYQQVSRVLRLAAMLALSTFCALASRVEQARVATTATHQ